MDKKKRLIPLLWNLLLVVFGNFFYALFIKLFLLPAELVTGGTTGLGLIAENFFHINLSLFVLIFNVVMLVVGFFVLGKQFAATTVASTFLYPIALELWNRLLGDLVITTDPLLCTIFSGIGIGIGLGIVIKSGASTGGMDIPPLILNKKFKIPVSIGLYFFDILILFGQMPFRSFEKVLYGILMVFVYSFVLDKILLAGNTKTEIKVVSAKSDEIKAAILTQIDRGVTMLYGEGGYLGNRTQIVLSIINDRELPKVEKLIRSIDPESFMIVSRVKEVSGRGFSMKKHYK